MTQIDPSIFKSYDIRGVYPTQLDEEVAYKIGRAYGTFIQNENPGRQLTIVVGRDMRLSSLSLKEKLVAGLLDQGLNVVEIGLTSTPTMYFATAFYGYDGGVEISASHNPKEYNGFKLVRARAVPISSETGINTIRDLAIAANFIEPSTKGILTEKQDVLTDLVKSEKEEWSINFANIKPLTIVVDAANAMGAIDFEAFFQGLPVKLLKYNWELDGHLPSHEPNPLIEENLKVAQEAVVKEKADLGICPDGDNDRIFFIDEKGEVIRQEILRGLMAQSVLKDFPGAAVCYDIRPGRITKDLIEQAGGRAFVVRVGHSHIKEAMLKEGAVFGGESSGHYFYKFSYGTFESPAVLIWKFLEFISLQNKPVSQIIAPYRIYFNSGEINSEVKSIPDTLAKIKEKYNDGELNEIDGITLTYPDFWFNVRGSNTEPLIRLTLEAKTKDLMEKKRDEVLALIRE